MANLFTRIKQAVAADFHEILDQKEQKNPIALLNQYLRQCEHETEKVRKLLERQYLLKEEFMREYRQAKDMEEKRKYQAEVASKAGENELYDFALHEQTQYEERAAKLNEALQQSGKQLEQLERKYEEMKHKLKDMHIKRMELMGRENIARANHRMNQVLDASQASQPIARFEEMEAYLDRLEHQVNSSYYRSMMDARIAELEKEAGSKEVPSIS
jgi:phage shock protein A